VWAYRSTTHTSSGLTPYSLVYGGKAVLPLEVQITSLRVAIHEKLTDDEAAKLRLNELDNVEENQLRALQNLEAYQVRRTQAFDKRLKRRLLKEGDLVLAVVQPMNITHRLQAKFEPKWGGSFRSKGCLFQRRISDHFPRWRVLSATDKREVLEAILCLKEEKIMILISKQKRKEKYTCHNALRA
jgi:hypothetical protein